ncbi:paraquat-inducible protein A [Burkholderia sp. BCC1988]|uniref:paraquat-inducible protein A n=1 Tax=Burkholderia sp. BCC1988 TaxID=2817443 RepID=UPI002AB149E2|nr:paraquat-inducible protein A [Burkholderia sp. BCC1988]
MSGTRLVVCHECDLLQWKTPLSEPGATRCRRCSAVLDRSLPATYDRALALTLAAAVVFAVANCFPIVALRVNGALVETTLFGAVSSLWGDGMWLLAGLVFVTTILMPALNVAAAIHLLLPLHMGRSPCRAGLALHVLGRVAPWGMVEVLMPAMLVALVKLGHYVTVVPGVGIWAFGAVMVLLATAAISFDPAGIWSRIDSVSDDYVASLAPQVGAAAPTEARAGLFMCRACGLVSKPLAHVHVGICPRCRAILHLRKPHSLARTWAFLAAAAALYIPAVVLPVMVTSTVFGTRSDTLLSGVALLWISGSWVLAMVVFIASIVVPMLKILSLTYLAWSTQLRSPGAPRKRTHVYRVVELVGRWSMLDIYVITILAALVRFGSVATIDAGPGAVAFGAVVVLTMLAALSFDPRLIWDAVEKEGE